MPIYPAPVDVQAGGEDLEAQVGVVINESHQFLSTVATGAPCDIADDFVPLGLVQVQ